MDFRSGGEVVRFELLWCGIDCLGSIGEKKNIGYMLLNQEDLFLQFVVLTL